jgi:hypothetical protein
MVRYMKPTKGRKANEMLPAANMLSTDDSTQMTSQPNQKLLPHRPRFASLKCKHSDRLRERPGDVYLVACSAGGLLLRWGIFEPPLLRSENSQFFELHWTLTPQQIIHAAVKF